MFSRLRARGQHLSTLVIVLLLIELLDELVFGAREATLPLLRDALQLDYIQIGVLIGVPPFVASFIEPFINVLADTRHRRPVMLSGGVMFTAMIIAIIASQSFIALLIVFVLIYLASGAFVGFAQAQLMDSAPSRHDQNMARWTFAGSLGVVGGPLLLSLVLSLDGAWQIVYVILAIVSLITVWLSWRYLPKSTPDSDSEEAPIQYLQSLKHALSAIRNMNVLRWVVLLQFSDLMMDILLSYLALYFVDVVSLTPATAAIAVTVWTGVGLMGDFAIIFLLERIDGVTYLRISAVLEFVLYTSFLLVDNLVIKLVILGLLGFFNAGWYSVLQGRLYSALPEQSGVVLVVGNIGGLFGAMIPFVIGAIASQWGLGMAMWFMLLGPVVILVGLPFRNDEPV